MADQNNQENSLVPESAPVESITPVSQQEVNPDAPRGDLFSGILDQDINNTNDYVKLNFEEIKDNLFTDQTYESILASQLEPGFMENLEAASNFINTNLTPTYSSPLEYINQANDNEAQSTLLESIKDVASRPQSVSDRLLKPQNVTQFGFSSSNFDRYYNHPNFNELGFHPYRDNDTFYNENSTWWDDHRRMWGQWGKVFGTGFTSTYDAIGDMFSTDGYLQADVEGADAFADAMRIGNSTKKGIGGFTNRLILNSGYTVGILASIAAEELVLAGLEYVTIGGATPIVASRTAFNIVRLGRITDKVGDAARASEALLKTMKNADEVAGFWARAGKWSITALTPNTVQAMKVWKTTQNTAQGLSTMAKLAKTSGGLYRDFRMMNLAMAESKLEAGMVKNDMFIDLYGEHKLKYGAAPEGQDLENITNSANNAAFTTTMINFPVIFFSNQFIFGTALRGFRGTASLMAAARKGIGGQIIKRGAKQIAKGKSKGFFNAGTGRLARWKARSLNGSIKAVVGGGLVYTSRNWVEGVQELIQEGTAVGAKDYYKNLYNDPAAGGLDAQIASVKAGVKSQMSHQGFEVFMSGFLMGGLVQGPQKWVFEDGPKLYEKYTDRETYDKHIKETENYIDQTVKVLNEVYEDPAAYFNPEKINILSQKQLAEDLYRASLDGEIMSFVDVQDESLFRGIHTVMTTGKAYEFRSELEDFLKLDDKMLAEAFPSSTAEEIKTGKTRDRITGMLNNLNDQEKAYKELNEKIVNTHDYSQFTVGTSEYTEEYLKWQAVNHAKMLALYTRKTFQRALERSNSIRQELANDPIISKMSARDIDVLTSMQNLITEIDILKAGLRVSKASEDPLTSEQKLQNDKNGKRLRLLQDYFSVLTDPKNIKKDENPIKPEDKQQEDEDQLLRSMAIKKAREDILSTASPTVAILKEAGKTSDPFGIFNPENIDELETSVNNYLKFIAETEDDFINHDVFKETLIKIVDYKGLNRRAEIYDNAIQFIMSPNKLNELADKFTVQFRDAFFKVVETELWLKGEGVMPERYFLEDREVSPITDKALYAKIEEAVGTYENLTRKKDSELEESEEEQFEDVQEDDLNYDDNFVPKTDEETGEVVEEDVDFESTVNLGKQHLAKKYRQYQTSTKGTVMSFKDWREGSISKQARKVSIALNKLSQEVYGPALLAGEKDSFNDWLMKNEEKEEVQNILKLMNLTVTDIIGKSTAPKEFNQEKIQSRQKVKKSHPSGVQIQEADITIEGEDKTIYRLVDNNNKVIEDQPYTTEEAAKEARAKIVRETKKDGTYEFAGETLKKSNIVIDKEGNKFIVMSQKKNVDKNNNLWVVPESDVKGKRKYITEEEFTENYSLVTEEIIEDEVKVAKLLTREPLQIYPRWDRSIKKEVERHAEGNKRLQELLIEFDENKQSNISLRVRRGPYWAKRETDISKLESFEFQEDTPNPRIKLQKDKLYIEIMSGEETIGFFQGTSTILLDTNGTVIQPLQITKQQAHDLFRRFKNSKGGYSKSIQQVVDEIKYNYTQAIAIEEALEKLFTNSKKDEIIVKVSDLENIGITLSEGMLAKVEGANTGASGVTFGELDYMFVNQSLDNKDVTTDGERPFFVMDYNRNYPTKNKKGVFSKTRGIPLNNIDTNKPGGEKLFREINQIFTRYESKASNLKGKYIALVNLPNGKYALVQLKPDTMQPEDVDGLLNSMKLRSVETAKEKRDPSYNTVWNKELNEGSPLDSPYNLPGVFLAAAEGVFVTLAINSKGGLNVSIRDFSYAEKNKQHRQKAFISYDALQKMNNAEDLIEALTSEDFPKFKPTMNTFKNTISKEGIDLNILSLASTKLKPQVKEGFYVTLNVEGEGASAVLNPIVRRSNVIKQKEDAEKKLIEEKKKVELSVEEIEDTILEDYENIDSSVLREIAEKLVNKEPLDEFQKGVAAHRREDIAALRLEIVTESVPDVSTPEEAEYQEKLAEIAKLEEKLKQYTKDARKSIRNELLTSEPVLYDQKTTDGIIALNKAVRQVIENDPKIAEMKLAIKTLNEDSNQIFKITKDFDGNDIEDIDTFRSWLEENLNTDLFTSLLAYDVDGARNVEDIKKELLDGLSNKMKDTFTTVGSFSMAMRGISNNIKDLRGVIFTPRMAPFKYHEAFHGVFRMLLTDAEITKYLGIAKSELRASYRTKKGYEIDPGVFVKSETEALDFLRSIHPGYAEMNVKDLSNVLYEEYIADRFDEFKMNPAATKTNTEIKSLFTRIIEWIKAVLGQFKADKSSQLNSLFRDIDSGKYKRAGVTLNRFTSAAVKGTPLIAYKKSIRLGYANIPYIKKDRLGKILRKKVSNVMPHDQQHAIVSGASNLYTKKLRNAKGNFNKLKALEESIILTIEMYNPERKFYDSKSEEWHSEYGENLENIYHHLNLQIPLITELVNDRLADITQKVNLESEEIEELEADGIRTTDEWGKSSDEIGGIHAMLDPELRDYIATTSINEEDIFGNKFFDDNETEPFVIGVDVHSVYNGILKATANEFNEIKILQKAWMYSRKNPNVKAFIDRFFKDVGLYKDAISQNGNPPLLYNDDYLLPKIKDSVLYQMFVNGFENARTESMFIHKDSSGIAHLYSATTKDDAHHTLSEWANAFNRKYRDIKIIGSEAHTEAIMTLNSLKQLLAIKDVATEQDLEDRISKTSQKLKDNLGMDMSPLYLEYSILKSVLDQSNFTAEQKILVDTFDSQEIITEVDVMEITNSINRGENIFLDQQETLKGVEGKTEGGVKSKLIKISLNNAPFSESVGATVFKDPEGNLIYAHQMPTYHLTEMAKMKGIDYVANKIMESPFFEENILLTDPTFQAMVEQNLVHDMRITGNKDSGMLNVSEEGVIRENKGLDINREPGVKYGDGTPKQFVLNLIHAYLWNYNRIAPKKTKTVKYLDDLGEMVEKAMAPNLIRVIEASNTGDFAGLGVYNAIEDSEEGLRLTDESVKKRRIVVKQSYERAQREADPKTRTEDLIYLGNTDKNNNRTDRGRLTKLDNVAPLLNSLKVRKNRAVNVQLPYVGEVVQNNIINGDIKVVIKEADAAAVSMLSRGQNAVVDIKGMQFVMYNQGSKKWTDLTNEEQTRLTEAMGTSLLTAEQERTRDNDRSMYSIQIGKETFYSYVFSDIKYFKGQIPKTIFSFVPLSEDSTVDIGLSVEQIKVKSQDEIQERIDKALDEENYQLVQVLKEKLDQIGDIDLVTAEVMDVDTSVIDALLDAIEKAREGEIVPFDEVFDKVNGEDAIRSRAMQNVNEMIITLKENGAYNDISKEIIEGLGRVQNKYNGRAIEKVFDDDANYYMELYNMKEDDLDYNLAQILLNDHTNTIGINQLLLGDEAYSLKDHIDAIKRAKMQNIAGPNASSIIYDEELGVLHANDIIKQFLFQDEMVQREFETIIEADRGKEASLGERTDGQMYITLKTLRHFLFAFGKLNKTRADILNKIVAGEKTIIDNEFFGDELNLSYKEKGMILNSMKLAYGDGQTYLKMSAVTLTPEFTSVKRNGVWVAREGREELHNLRVKLEKYEEEQWANGSGVLGIAVPASASKMMKVNMQTTDQAFNSDAITDDMVTNLSAEHMRLQVINPSNKIEVVDPRQIKNLITSEQDDSIIVIIGGVEISIGEVRRMYNLTLNQRDDNEYFKRRNLITTFSGSQNELIKAQDTGQRMTVNLTAFLKYAIKGLESSQAKAQMMDYFQMDEFGEPKYDLNNQRTVKKFQELFFAFFNKGVLSMRQPGISAALMSDAGFKVVKQVMEVDENGTPTRWRVIRSNDWEGMKTLDPSLRTAKYTNTEAETFSGLKVNEYYLDHLRSNVMTYNADGTESGIRGTEFVMPPHFKSILTSLNIDITAPLPDAIAKMFGIRIPSQDKHSAVNLILVDFLPVYMGSTAIFSRDLAEISGADFDIDKLYMHIKDFYVRDGEFIEYGSATNETEAYQDYIKFTLREYGKKDSSLHMAVEEFLRREKSIENAERIGIDKVTVDMNPVDKKAFLDNYVKDKKLRLKVELFNLLTHDTSLGIQMEIKLYNRAEGLAEGMKMLGLPVTEKEYIEYKEKYNGREPYRAVQDNKILDYKYALLGNKGMTDPRSGRITGIASEPAVLTPLTDANATGIVGEGVWEYIQRELPELAEELGEEGVDVNWMQAKMTAWDNNKEGARSIGAVVRPNILVNILQEYGIKLETKIIKGKETFPRLKLNGNTKYDDFSVEYTINPQTGKEDNSLHRKQFVISALVTAMTDNAKERLAKKLGLTKSSLSIVTTMLSLGVDIKTVVLLIKHPTIANIFEQSKQTKKGPLALLKMRKGALQAALDKYVDDFDITTESLTRMNKHFNAINNGVPKLDRSESAVTVGIPSEDKGGWTNEELQYDLDVINNYITAADISESLREMSELIDLQKGWGRDLEAMQKKETEKEFKNSKIPVNVRDIFLKAGSTYHNKYQTFREGYDHIAPAFFIQRTESFEKMYNTLINNLNSNIYFTKGMESKISIDLITYLNTKSYIHNLEKNSFQSWQTASLQNGMIYENQHFPGVSAEALNVADVVIELREYVKSVKKSTNYMLDQYISLIETDSENNNTGSTLVTANTWTRIDDAELTRIQNSFLELFQDPNTHQNAVHLINYLLVRDGFQLRPNTFLEAIPADLTSDILNTIGPIHQLFKSSKPQESQFMEIFGLTYEELFNDFLEGYMSANKMDYYLNHTKIGGEISVYNTQKIEIPETSILVDWNAAESSSNTQILSNEAPRIFKYSHNNKEYEFGSVIHAYQVLKQGKFDKKVDKVYRKEGIDKAHGKTIETKLAKTRGFNQEALLKQLIRASFMQKNPITVNGVEVRNELIRHSDFTFMVNDKLSKTTREGLLEVQKDMVYNVKEDGSMTIISRAGIRTQERRNAVLIKQPMVRNATEKTFIVNAFKGVDAKYTDKVKIALPVYDFSKIKKGEQSPQAQLAENLRTIKKDGGFRIVYKEFKVKGGDRIEGQIALPFVIKNSVGQGKAATDTKYYKLTKVYPNGKMPVEINAFEMMNSEENVALGNLGVYIEIETFGSISSTATAFALPGYIPTKTEIETYINEKNNIFGEENADISNVEEEVDIEDVTPEEQHAETTAKEVTGEELFKKNEDPFVDLDETTTGTGETINIYAGTGENANLSNFAERSYTDPLGVEFRNVESAFQYAKTNWIQEKEDGKSRLETYKVNDEIRMKLQSTTGAEARALGKKIRDLDVEGWDNNSATIMKGIIKDSFEQNSEALQELLATGNAELTHTQDKGKWGKEFPRILMEVRKELSQEEEIDVDNVEEEVDIDNVVIDEENKLADGGAFFSSGSIAEQAKANPSDIKLENAWNNLTADEQFSAANVFRMYSVEDLITRYNTTNDKTSISVSKFMENLKCGL